MKLIPSPATRVWEEGGMLKAEWADLSLDDEDRETEASVFLTAEVEADHPDAMRVLHSRLRNEFDKWIKDTR